MGKISIATSWGTLIGVEKLRFALNYKYAEFNEFHEVCAYLSGEHHHYVWQEIRTVKVIKCPHFFIPQRGQYYNITEVDHIWTSQDTVALITFEPELLDLLVSRVSILETMKSSGDRRLTY